jgi:peptide/nickel transport system permease protein
MKRLRIVASVFLAVVLLASVLADLIAPSSYDYQFRDIPNASCSRQHLLGTDALGRDRFSRLLFGTRISLLLAPAAALLSALLAALIGGAAGYAGGRVQRLLMAGTDLFLSLSWMFLLLTVRALLPLNTAPATSIAFTFALLGCLGWAGAARVVCADAQRLRDADFLLLARASGCTGHQVFRRHFLPNLRPVLMAQFWISIPVFILAEANLGILGLGVAEPLPSWGGLLQELQSVGMVSKGPWVFLPVILLIATVSSFHILIQREELRA